MTASPAHVLAANRLQEVASGISQADVKRAHRLLGPPLYLSLAETASRLRKPADALDLSLWREIGR